MFLTRNQKSNLSSARTLSRWFQVKVEIRLFGKLVWSYVWPPDAVVSNEVVSVVGDEERSEV